MIDMSNLQYNTTCLNAFNKDSWLWHKRLGHVSFDHLSRINTKEVMKGISYLKFEKTIAFAMRANLRNKPSPLQNNQGYHNIKTIRVNPHGFFWSNKN